MPPMAGAAPHLTDLEIALWGLGFALLWLALGVGVDRLIRHTRPGDWGEP